MSQLPDPVHEVLEDTVDEARVQRLWRGIEGQRPRRRGAPLAVAGALAAAAAALLFWLWPRPPAPLALEGGAPIPARLDGAIALDDGSTVTPSAGARLTLVRNDPEAITWALEAGRARFSVTPGGPRAWRVLAGEVEVQVVGTIFEVDRGDAETTVHVERGRVEVTHPTGTRLLTAGTRFRFPNAPAHPPVPLPVPVPLPESPIEMETEPETEPESESESGSESETETGSESESESESEPAPLVSAEQAMAVADEARREGREREAASILERASQLRGDPAAGLAAFTLGRLELDRLNRPARAARAFSRALDLSLPPRLREDAAARLVDAHVAAGDERAAALAANFYLRDYPNGRHRARVRPHAGP